MWTLAETASYEEEIKRSRFIAVAIRLDDPSEAPDWLEALRQAEATHNCWAWRVGDAYRSSDDGEPGGTAGRPILAAIEKQGLDCVLVVVTRYYGGVKLGAGGLVRAYGGTAAKCLHQAALIEVLPTAELELAVPFARTGPIWQLIEERGATRLEERWDERGLRLRIRISEDQVEALAAGLTDVTRGEAELTRL
ncbi:MAG: YigZ family protein [Deltaproteobacteria bacterium]|nr:YigZ family protein [Deltaproteobacteria bacterium]